ncbi:MAG: aldehyde dehydrogenase family protein, partial [Phycisphaerae bacterium]
MITSLLGRSFLGYARSTGTTPCGHAIQPGAGTPLEPAYFAATPAEVDHAMALAAAAFPAYSNLSGKSRAGFLRAIASEIEGVGEDLVERGVLETALA